MAGIYGNSAEDRYYEKMLDDYLDSYEPVDDDIEDEAGAVIETEIKDKEDIFREFVDERLTDDEAAATNEPADIKGEEWAAWYDARPEKWRKHEEDAYIGHRLDEVMHDIENERMEERMKIGVAEEMHYESMREERFDE